jgi:hypothetical protein
MVTVFLSGSITITRLNSVILVRLQNIMDKQFAIVIGDANGADKALQKHLASSQYPHVTVFCTGNVCRNNLGNWSVKHIAVDANITGRAFYTQKDKAMAQVADYGFVLWDGKSPSSFNNVLAFLAQRKTLSTSPPHRRMSANTSFCKRAILSEIIDTPTILRNHALSVTNKAKAWKTPNAPTTSSSILKTPK